MWMGTMANTLILAYTGSSVPLLMMIYGLPGSVYKNG